LYQRENEKDEESDEVCRGRESTKKEKIVCSYSGEEGKQNQKQYVWRYQDYARRETYRRTMIFTER
jgi:hypothetical protein